MISSHIDLLIRIKNGCMVKKREVIVPFSRINQQILKKLKNLNFIEDFLILNKDNKRINILLKYDGNSSVITDIKIISKPGKKVYTKKSNLALFKRTASILILSTSKGIMTNKEAKAKNIGGELLFEIG